MLFPFLMALVCAAVGPRWGRRTGYLAALAFVPALLLALPELLPTLMAESLVTYDVVPVIFEAAPAVPSVPHPASSLP